MKIVTYNFRNLFDVGTAINHYTPFVISPEFVDGMIDNILMNISKIQPDVLAAQEIGSPKLFERIASQATPSYNFFIADGDPRGIANGVLFRDQAETKSLADVFTLTTFVQGNEDTIGKNISNYRHFAYLKTDYAGRPLHIIAIHLKSGIGIPQKNELGEKIPIITQLDSADATIRASIFKLAQARQLRSITDEILKQNADAQIIILGDFNATEWSDVLKIIKGGIDEQANQLINACEQVPSEKRFSHMGRGNKRLIDHILITKNLVEKITNVEILNEYLQDQEQMPADTTFESDHAPVVLTLL